MKLRLSLWILLLAAITLTSACYSGAATPKQLIDTYFSSAVKQDYAAVYNCYYAAYKAKVSEDEYIKHRKEASVLQSYQIASLKQDGDTAEAQVLLTFAPSATLKRTKPVSMTVTENMVRQSDGWKIKVWE